MKNNVFALQLDKVTRLTAEWCGPCGSYGPVFDEVSSELEGVWIFNTLDIDTPEGEEFAKKFGIKGIPTTVVERNRSIPQIVSGLITKEHLLSLLEK
jgi:thiol-disulfide isomerase/thioredoxin